MFARLRSLRRPCCLGLAVLGSFLAGCAETGPGPRSTSYMISSARADFFKYGPAQAFGPDLALKQGDRVTLLQKQFGFSHVMLADGTSGYVPTEDLAPAPAPPVTRPAAGSSSRSGAFGRLFSGARKNSDVKPTPGDPLFDVTDVPTPLPTDGAGGTEAHAPNFRYAPAKRE